MKRHEALLFYSMIDNLLPYMDEDLQKKMEFAKNIINDMTIKNLKNTKISLGPMDTKTLQALIFSILLKYDSIKEPKLTYPIDMDTVYLDTEEIFPIREMKPEEVTFIEHCLDKICVNLESEQNEVYVLNANQLLFLVRGIMWEYETFLNNGKKFD